MTLGCYGNFGYFNTTEVLQAGTEHRSGRFRRSSRCKLTIQSAARALLPVWVGTAAPPGRISGLPRAPPSAPTPGGICAPLYRKCWMRGVSRPEFRPEGRGESSRYRLVLVAPHGGVFPATRHSFCHSRAHSFSHSLGFCSFTCSASVHSWHIAACVVLGMNRVSLVSQVIVQVLSFCEHVCVVQRNDSDWLTELWALPSMIFFK